MSKNEIMIYVKHFILLILNLLRSPHLANLILRPVNPFTLFLTLKGAGQAEEARLMFRSINDFIMDGINNNLRYSLIIEKALQEHDWVLHPEALVSFSKGFLKQISEQNMEIAHHLCDRLNLLNDKTSHIFEVITNEFAFTASPDTLIPIKLPNIPNTPNTPPPSFSIFEFIQEHWIPIAIGSVIVVGIGVGLYYWLKDSPEVVSQINIPKEEFTYYTLYEDIQYHIEDYFYIFLYATICFAVMIMFYKRILIAKQFKN